MNADSLYRAATDWLADAGFGELALCAGARGFAALRAHAVASA